jgi:V/A-type H+-transporting ATPase subunit I
MQMAVLFGMVMISAGIILNIINAFSNRRFLEAVFDPAGLVGGLFYWLAAGLLIKSIKFHSPPPLRWIVILLGFPVLLFFLKGPISQLVRKEKKLFPEGFFSYFMESGMALLETAIGYAANTISFIRVAAFALAHIGLFIAVFSLAETVRRAGGAGAQWAVLAGGNIGIILLEGVVVTVQSVRLEYYEFFSRFFSRHEGVAYRPLKMTVNDETRMRNDERMTKSE